MGDPAVVLNNVSLSYAKGHGLWRRQRFQALDGIDLRIDRGERVGVVGRNGAGKSSLLKLIADVIAPDSGHIERNHGFCQLLSINLGFVPHLTGRENAILGGLLQGLHRNFIESRLAAVQEFSELGDFFDEPFKTYSSGMQARLGFSLAMQFAPDILLVDEVLGVGDSAFQAKSRQALQERMRSGITVVMVSHSDEIVRGICDRLLWIEHGRRIMYGSTNEVLSAYHSPQAQAQAQAQARTG